MSARALLLTAAAAAGLAYSAAAGLLPLPAEVASVVTVQRAAVPTVQEAPQAGPQAPAVAASGPAPTVLLCTPQAGAQGAPQAVAAAPGAAGLVNLNTASESELDGLPGVGKARTASIVRYRQAHAFGSVGELAKVKGFTPAVVAELAPLVTV